MEECATAMARTERDRKASSFRSPVDLQEPYIALVDMGKIIRHNRSDYVQKVSSIIFRHNNATHIICVNDPYDTAYSTKDDKQDLRVQGSCPQYLHDPFPSARAFKTCSVAPATKGG